MEVKAAGVIQNQGLGVARTAHHGSFQEEFFPIRARRAANGLSTLRPALWNGAPRKCAQAEAGMSAGQFPAHQRGGQSQDWAVLARKAHQAVCQMPVNGIERVAFLNRV